MKRFDRFGSSSFHCNWTVPRIQESTHAIVLPSRMTFRILRQVGPWAIVTIPLLFSGCARPPIAPIAPSTRPLQDIVGEWQSDTVGGSSARSTCQWSPQRNAVICEQTITSTQSVRHTVNVYTTDIATGNHYYYGIVRPGDSIAATRLQISGHVWTYGGEQAAPNGTYYRTINDFSSVGRYTWRTEASSDRANWTVVREGKVVRTKMRSP